jgi:hypothetical protein
MTAIDRLPAHQDAGSRQRRQEPDANLIAFPTGRVVVPRLRAGPGGSGRVGGAVSGPCRRNRSEDSRSHQEPSPVPEPPATAGRVSHTVRGVSHETEAVFSPESLAEFIERHRCLWAKQGLPPKVIDGPTLDAIAIIVRSSRRDQKVNCPSRPTRSKKGHTA